MTSITVASMDPLDIEKQRVNESSTYVSASPEDSVLGTPAPDYTGFFGRLRYYEKVLDRKFGVESQGPERVLPEERTKPNQLIMFCVWASGMSNDLGPVRNFVQQAHT